MTITRKQIENALTSVKNKSAWNKGINNYAFGLIDNIDFSKPNFDKSDLLNGASDWSEYSWGGNGLIYDTDIAAALCTPSELKRCKGGENRPNSREEWLDVQSRALFQAANRLQKIIHRLEKEEEQA